MKNKISRRIGRLSAVILLTACVAVLPADSRVYGASAEEKAVGLTMNQSIAWTNEKNYQAELTVEISGLQAWLSGNSAGGEQKTDEEEAEDREEFIDTVPSQTTVPIPTEAPDTERDSEAEQENNSEETSNSDAYLQENLSEEVIDQDKDSPEISPSGNISSEDNPSEDNSSDNNLSDNSPLPSEDNSSETIPLPSDSISSESISSDNISSEDLLSEEQVSEDIPLENSSPESSKEKAGEIRNICRADRKPAAVHAFIRNTCSEIRQGIPVSTGDEGTLLQNGTETEERQVILAARISGYFQVDGTGLPKGSSVKEVMLPGENGELTQGTEVTCIIPLEDQKETITVKIPLILREEYRYSETSRAIQVFYINPLVQMETADAENEATDTGKTENEKNVWDVEETRRDGMFLAVRSEKEFLILAEEEPGLTLEASAALADYTVTVKTDSENPKAGQTLTYQVTVSNTGAQPLPLVSLESTLTPSSLTGIWTSKEGQEETDASGRSAILSDLKIGQSRTLLFKITLPETQAEPVVNVITASAQKMDGSEENLEKKISVKTKITSLTADFAVVKTADRTSAAPGDTITYQICIRNTGERTLHSVVSTERFQTENIHAQFVEKEGVVLNSDKTQALIAQIPPGEVASLEAVVVLPEKLESKELINEVLVRTKETGDQVVQSQAGVEIVNVSPAAVSPTEVPEKQDSGDTTLTASSDSPRTADDAKPEFWKEVLVLALAVAAVSGGCTFFRKRLRKN